MSNAFNKLVVIIAAILIATFVMQTILPVAVASNNNVPGSSKAQPWPSIMPKQVEIPLVSSLPKDKVSPKIFEQIDNGAKSVQAIIVYDWNYRDQVLLNLPPGTRLLKFATEMIQYVPILGVEFPADKEGIKKLGDLPYVKLIAYNEPLDAKKMLQFIDPNQEIQMIKDEPKPSAIIPSRFWVAPSEIAQEVNATALYNMGITGKGVLIGIIDTAINPRHPDFFFPNGTSKIVFTFSPYSGEDAYSTYYDINSNYGHGTHVTSIAAGSGVGSGEGWYLDRNTFLYRRATISAGLDKGLAPDAKIAFFKIFPDPNLTPEPGTVYHIAVSILQAVKVGVDVINSSWGFTGFDVDTQAVLYYMIAWAIQSGVAWVSAAGNYGPGYVTLGFPGAQESVITVGITYPINYPTPGYGGSVVYWSSRGPTYPANSFFQHGTDIIPTTGFLSAGRAKPDVVAPGFGVMAANAGFEIPSPYTSFDALNPPSGATINVGTKYKTLSGTSMSSPVVTGIVALLIQAFPGATPAAIKAALIKGATPVSTVQGVSDPNIGGAGKVNAYKAWKILNEANKKPNFVIPSPYWAEAKKVSPDAYKQIFAGYRILVDDVTALSDRNNWFDFTVTPQYNYYNFINDLRSRGASIDYLSSKFPAILSTVTVNQVIESPHPYQPLTDQFYHIYYPGARYIAIHFQQIGLGLSPSQVSGAYIVVYNWDYTSVVFLIVAPPGDISNIWYPFVAGPGVHIRLVAANTTGYGFKVDQYQVLIPKPSTVNYNIRREVLLRYYWLNAPVSQNPWSQNLANANPPINVPLYQDTSSDPWYRKEYNFYTLTFNNLVSWFNVTGSISQCYWPYIPKGNFSAFDIWLPVASYGFNYTSAFNPNSPPSLSSLIAADKAGTGSADILYVNATVYDTVSKTYTWKYLYIQVYDYTLRSGATNFTDLVSFAHNTVPKYLSGASPKYGATPIQYLTGVDSWKWIRIVADLSNPSRYKIFVNATRPLQFWFITNGDSKGGSGINAPFIALGSQFFYSPAVVPPTTYISIFNTVIVSGTTNKPNAIFFAQYDLVLILTPWYVDNAWINSTELKKYVDNYIGRVLFVGGYIPRSEFGITFSDEPIYMLPMGSEIGTGVKMNNYTLPFGVDWIPSSVGGRASLTPVAASNPIFAPWVDPDGNLQAPVLYLGHQVMSMRTKSVPGATVQVWARDPLYNALVFYNSTNCNGALFLSDASVLSDVTYGRSSFAFHQWFGLRAVAYLLDPLPPNNLLQKVNQWFYPIGGPASGNTGLFVMIKYNKIVTNNTLWLLNVTFTNTLPYNVALNVTLKIPSNSTIAGLKPVSGYGLTKQFVINKAGRDNSGNVVPTVVSILLGGNAYTKPLATTNTDMKYYPVYTAWWSTFKINLYVYGNLTQTGTIDFNNPIYSHENRAVSVLNKPPRAGDLPLVTTSWPFSVDSYTSNLIAKYPLDFKYFNFTVIDPNPSISTLHAQIVGNVSAVAQFFTLINETIANGVWRVKLVLLGSSMDLKPEDVGAIAAQQMDAYQVPLPIPVPVIVRLQDGHYPGLPHTGHYYAPVFVFIDPNISSGVYSGQLQVFDDNNTLVATSDLTITVEQSPNGYFVWDDGLYVNNRPAVDNPANYHGVGQAVFTAHDWPMQPWINAFELWRTLSRPELNFAIKPSGVITLALDMIASNQTPNQPLWKIESFYRDLVNRAFGPAQGFLLIGQNHFQPFTGYYFNKEINYGPETRTVSYTARDIMVKILANGGTLLVFAQYDSANNVNPVTGSTNQYNMNWVLNYVGSRVYFVTADMRSAARDVMPFTEGLPSFSMPLAAGWNKITVGGIPYNTLDFYYLLYLDSYTYNQTNRKLFLDVNSRNLDPNNIATYSKYILPAPIETPSPYSPLATTLYKITVPNADYVLPVFDYIDVSNGTLIQVLDSNFNPVGSFYASNDTEKYGSMISTPVRGDTVYIKFAAGAAVKPGFDKGIKVSYVLYTSTAYLNDLANFYVKNDDRPDFTYVLSNGAVMSGWQAVAGRWGPGLVLDTRLTGVMGSYGNIPLPNAKVIAFGEYSWFSNEYFQHAITHFATPIVSESRWAIILQIFLRSIFQYAAGYYNLVTSGMQALTTFVDYLNLLATNARNAGMTVTVDFDNLINQAKTYINQAKFFTSDGNYIAAAKPLIQANSTVQQAANILVTQLSSQALNAENTAWSAISNATKFINTTASYNVDIAAALSLIGQANAAFKAANSTLANFVSSDPATWTALIDSFKGFNSATNTALSAWRKAGDLAYNLATLTSSQASQALSTLQSQINQLTGGGIPVSDNTRTLVTTAVDSYNKGVTELGSYNAGDFNTYSHALNALTNFRNAQSATKAAQDSLFADARSTVASKLSDLRAKIAEVKAKPHDEALLSSIEARIPDLESRLNSAASIADYVKLFTDINGYIAQANAAVITTTPTTPFPLFQLAIIIILIIVLVFALVYALSRRRARAAVLL